LLRWAASIAPQNSVGQTLEFGVGAGASLKLLAAERGTVTGFDTFTGLPEDWRTGYPAGTFGAESQAALEDLGMDERITLIQGLFEDTLPRWCAEMWTAGEPDPGFSVGLLHVDSDLYGSAATVLHNIEPHLIDGAVVVFDEYWNYPGWQSGEFKALAEWKTRFSWKYLAYNEFGEQVAIRLSEEG
jgi:predicted O-methyltransferase YrrM